ncbi:Sarcolemmal membrane-associated protein [Armadillidium vulgare]|nr:Sarcolemmal membrane-associated protein [Armadillidium vulgare]
MVYLGNIVAPPLVENIHPSYKVKMPATAILQCRPNSHPFPDRTLILDEPVKIGRSVARARPAANNAIFDCKVLSRNHALLWYENGKFYLKDTKSSNGTFVNNYRLSKGSEESAPQEVCSGDIVQYGVDVMENSKKGTVTHGCIIATLKLYLPDGQEAKASLSTAVGGGMCNISSQELHQLRTSLQEAQHREELIESKLSSFQQIITSIQEAASQSWTAMIDEDRLLQRLETLEDQLATYSKNCTDDSMREEIQRVIEEKNRYETSAKDSIQRILQEKVDAVSRCSELERTLSVTKTELNHKKELAESAQNELQELLAKQTEQMLELKKLTEKLQCTEEKLQDSLDKTDAEKRELELKLQEKTSEGSNLLVKIESLKADNDFTKEQLSAVKAKYENIKNGRLSFGSITGKDIKDFEFNDEEVKKTFQLFRSAVQALQDRLWQAQEELHQTQSSLAQLKCEAEAADKADLKCQTMKAQLQDELNEKKTKEESNSALIDHLQSQLGVLEARLMDISPDTPKIYEDIYEDNNTLCKYKKGAKDEDNRDECKDEDNEKEVSDKDNEDSDSSDSTLTLISTNDVRFLSLTESSRNSAKEELKRIREEFGKASTASVTAAHEAANLHHQLAANEAILMEKMRYVSTLQEIGGQLESSVESIYVHLNALTQRIAQQKEEILNSKNDCDDVKEKLREAESLSQKGVDQMEILRAKLKEFEFSLKDTDEASQPNSLPSNSSHIVKNSEAIENTSQEQKHEDSEDPVPKLKAEIETLQRAYEGVEGERSQTQRKVE